MLLHDVDAATHPLRIARGSHRTVYYRYHDVAASRFTGVPHRAPRPRRAPRVLRTPTPPSRLLLCAAWTDAYVENRYETVALTGQLGDGFVFDTNALHKATAEGATKARSVVMFEMNARARAAEMRRWAGAPCPSSSEFLAPLVGTR